MGIDGFSFMLHEPVQVKQSSGVGRNVVDNFETAVKRSGKTKGYIVAFSFGKGAHEEAARVKGADGLTIELLKVSDLLEGMADLVTPEGGLWGADAPMPEPRAPEARPSIEELIASDAGEQLGKVAESPAAYPEPIARRTIPAKARRPSAEHREGTPMKVAAYHSTSPEDMQRQRYVHHDHDHDDASMASASSRTTRSREAAASRAAMSALGSARRQEH